MKRLLIILSLFCSLNVVAKNIRTVVFDTHLHCENCVKKVVENISFEKGVKDLNVSLKDQTISVTFDADKTSVPTLIGKIEKLGYQARERK